MTLSGRHEIYEDIASTGTVLEPAQDVIADRPPWARRSVGEGSRGDERIPKLLGQILHPNDFVHRRTDQRELQPLRHADIAVDDFAEMERGTEVKSKACLGCGDA